MTSDLVRRPRRLRSTAAMRRLTREASLHPRQLVLPVFVKDGISEPIPVASMPGVQQWPLEQLDRVVEEAARAGLGGVMLFGIPSERDAQGSGATDPDGILNRAISRAVAAANGRLVVQADLCLDEFTEHGHCGVLATDGSVDNDATLQRYREMALAQARAGAHLLGLSGMMDGQVAAVRNELDRAGFTDVALLAYSAKYASVLYGPFRDAVDSTFRGERTSYQLDPANGREGWREAELDIAEGADIVMVKPAGWYLDVLARIAETSTVPVWAYQVSGEYAAIELASSAGLVDRTRAITESLTAIRRAGAEVILSYWAVEVANWLNTGSFE